MRLTALASALTMLLCTGAAAEEKIVFLTETGSIEAAARALIPQFEEENPGIQVELQTVPYDQFLQIITTRIIGGEVPDVAYMRGRFASALYGQGVLADIGGRIPDDYLDTLADYHRDEHLVDGTRYAVPITVNIQALMVNRDMVRKAGFEVPVTYEDAWTWQELLTIARELKAKGIVETPLLHWPASTPSRLSQYLFAEGGSILTPDLSGPNLDNDIARSLLNDFKATFEEGLSPRDNWAIDSDTAVERWLAGEAAIIIGGGNFKIPTIDRAGGAPFDWTFSPMPVTLGQSAPLVMFEDSEAMDAGAAFMTFLLKPDNITTIAASAFNIPTRRDISDRILVETYGGYAEQVGLLMREQLKGISPGLLGEMNFPLWPEIDLMIRTKLEGLAIGQLTPDEVIEQSEEEIRTIIERN